MLFRGDRWYQANFADLMAVSKHFTLIVDLTVDAWDSMAAAVSLMMKDNVFSPAEPEGLAFMGLDAHEKFTTLALNRRQYELSNLFQGGATVVGCEDLPKLAAQMPSSTVLARTLGRTVVQSCNESCEMLAFNDSFECTLPRKAQEFVNNYGLKLDSELEDMHATLFGTQLCNVLRTVQRLQMCHCASML